MQEGSSRISWTLQKLIHVQIAAYMNEWGILHSGQWLMNTAVVRPPSVAAGAELSRKHVCWVLCKKDIYCLRASQDNNFSIRDLLDIKASLTQTGAEWMHLMEYLPHKHLRSLLFSSQRSVPLIRENWIGTRLIICVCVCALTCMLCLTGFNYPTTFVRRTLLHFHFGFDPRARSNEEVVIIPAMSR